MGKLTKRRRTCWNIVAKSKIRASSRIKGSKLHGGSRTIIQSKSEH
jgi:hypothetical protein